MNRTGTLKVTLENSHILSTAVWGYKQKSVVHSLWEGPYQRQTVLVPDSGHKASKTMENKLPSVSQSATEDNQASSGWLMDNVQKPPVDFI